jgi:Activator of Hsp90 ATPase homolog 1-like protein
MTIVKSILLPLAPAAAFDLFTFKINAWWPTDRRHTRDPKSEIFLLQDGRFFERTSDGREVELGAVRSWQKPNLILLDFFIATGPDQPTEVEITFVSEQQGTRLTVTHRPKPESAHLWAGHAPRYQASWEIVLTAFSRAPFDQGCYP